jgi:hypothetical protein
MSGYPPTPVGGGASRRQRAFGNFARRTLTPLRPGGRDELALAIAEIERARQVLRQWEPGLERGIPSLFGRRQPRAYWTVWLMIGLVWMVSSVTIVSATAAILYLFR